MKDLSRLTSLKVFEAAARHVHFTRAAHELGISQAAVSYHVGSLEARLNVKLFNRRHRILELTPAGQTYLKSVREAFDILSTATAEITQQRLKSTLTVRAYSTFAMLWLLPRMHRFKAQHPDIDVNILNSALGTRVNREDCDVMIRYGVPTRSDGSCQRLFKDVIAPVGKPGTLFLQKDGTATPGQTIIHCSARPHDWIDWASYVGAKLNMTSGVTFGISMLAFEAAKEGLGIAMGQLPLLDAQLRANELEIVYDIRMERPEGYFLMQTHPYKRDSRVRAFIDWIVGEAERMKTGTS